MLTTAFIRQWAGWLAASLLLLTTPLAAQNIALNKPVTVTTSQGGFPGKQANDGDANTRWGSEYDTSLTTVLPDSNSIYIDLQGMATLTQVYLNWETALGRDFKIEVSDDAKTWTGLLKVTGNTSRTNTLAVSGKGRYVRMHGLKRGTGFGYSLWEFQVTGTLAPLPVLLVAFSATPQSAAVALQWATATELHNTGFEVQRSADGVAYASLAFVAGAGNSQSLRTYSYLDAQPLSTMAYYRLKQVDLDGAATYGPVVAVQAAETLATIYAYPNPTTDRVTLEWGASASPTRWFLTNSAGQVVHQEAVNPEASPNSLSLSLQPYPAGSYVLTLETAGQAARRTRVQKLN